MRPRKELQERLQQLCPNVYFNPPPSVAIHYPCIIYHRSLTFVHRADDVPFLTKERYDLTYIAKDTDEDWDYINDIPKQSMRDKLLNAFDMISHDRFYTSDNLNHDSFTLYF